MLQHLDSDKWTYKYKYILECEWLEKDWGNNF